MVHVQDYVASERQSFGEVVHGQLSLAIWAVMISTRLCMPYTLVVGHMLHLASGQQKIAESSSWDRN